MLSVYGTGTFGQEQSCSGLRVRCGPRMKHHTRKVGLPKVLSDVSPPDCMRLCKRVSFLPRDEGFSQQTPRQVQVRPTIQRTETKI